jgi:glucose-1-phosphate adenylyltransferase
VPPGEAIGYDESADRRRFHVTPSGIVVVPAGFFPPRDTASAPFPQRSGTEAATSRGTRAEEFA